VGVLYTRPNDIAWDRRYGGVTPVMYTSMGSTGMNGQQIIRIKVLDYTRKEGWRLRNSMIPPLHGVASTQLQVNM